MYLSAETYTLSDIWPLTLDIGKAYMCTLHAQVLYIMLLFKSSNIAM